MHVFTRVFRYVKRYPAMAAGTLACAICGTLMVVVFPAITQVIVDEVIRKNQPRLLLPLVAVGLAAFVAQDLLNGLRIFLNNHFEQRVICDLRSDLYAHIQSLPLRWFDNRATGDIMTRLVEDVTALERVLIDGIEQGTVAVLQLVIVSGLMLAYSPTLTAVALAPIPLLGAGALAYTLTARSRYRLQRRAASDLNALLHDNISGIRQIKAYTSEKREHGRFNAAGEKLRQATLIVMRVWAIYHPAMNFLASCGMLLIAGFGAHRVLNHQMDIGVLVAFLVLARFLYEPIGRLHQLNQLFQAGRAAGERVFEILDEAPETRSGSGLHAPAGQGRVPARSLFLHARAARAPGYQPACAPGRDDRSGRPHRRWQVHNRQSSCALLRIRLRANPARWAGDSNSVTPLPPGDDRRGELRRVFSSMARRRKTFASESPRRPKMNSGRRSRRQTPRNSFAGCRTDFTASSENAE